MWSAAFGVDCHCPLVHLTPVVPSYRPLPAALLPCRRPAGCPGCGPCGGSGPLRRGAGVHGAGAAAAAPRGRCAWGFAMQTLVGDMIAGATVWQAARQARQPAVGCIHSSCGCRRFKGTQHTEHLPLLPQAWALWRPRCPPPPTTASRGAPTWASSCASWRCAACCRTTAWGSGAARLAVGTRGRH